MTLAALGALVLSGCYEARERPAQGAPKCGVCHGTDESPAPPPGIWLEGGKTDRSESGVGAHAAHLSGSQIAAPLACATCHVVPATVNAPGHLDPAPAEVTFSGRATARGVQADYDGQALTCTVYCHGLDGAATPAPKWTDDTAMACGSCHGMPPAMTRGGFPHPAASLSECASCHPAVVDDAGKIIDLPRHINGVVDVAPNIACNACHGGPDNAAPPMDVQGNTDVASRGVGLHQIHVRSTARHAAYPCATCHVVPNSIRSAGHLDDVPGAEITFGGIATGETRTPAAGLKPTWDGEKLTCASVYCHALDGGGVPELKWTEPRRLVCGSCHGLPPEKTLSGANHPASDLGGCYVCHPTVNAQGGIADPSLHANGVVDTQ